VLQSLSRRWLRPEYGVGFIVVLGLLFLALPFLPLPDPPLAGWGAFLGRFHPLIVHFPIVLVVVPLMLEAAAWIGRQHAFLKLVPVFWALAALSCMAAVVAGYLLYASGEYVGDLIRDHLWAGVVLVILVLSTAALSVFPRIRSSRRWGILYLSGALLTNAAVVYAGHLGGSLTHGEDFISNAFPGWGYQATIVETRPREELLVLQDLVIPGFEMQCMSCHNPQQAKGDFDMTTLAALQRGGESGKPMFVPERADSSELFRRVTLPPGDDDRMPPEGKPALSSDVIAILEWWIEEGARPDMRLEVGPSDPMRQAVIERYLPRLVVIQRRRMRERRRRAALHRELQGIADELGLVVEVDPGSDSTLFALSMRFPPGRVDDRTLARLAPHAAEFSKLSLVSSDVTDEGLRHVAGMHNLRELILQKTAIDGSGLPHLESIRSLEVLNLAHTALNDSGSVNLLHMPSLKEVYLYNTAVSDSILEDLRAHMPETDILEVEGPPY